MSILKTLDKTLGSLFIATFVPVHAVSGALQSTLDLVGESWNNNRTRGAARALSAVNKSNINISKGVVKNGFFTQYLNVLESQEQLMEFGPVWVAGIMQLLHGYSEEKYQWQLKDIRSAFHAGATMGLPGTMIKVTEVPEEHTH